MTDVLGAVRHLGVCLRDGKHMFMGVAAENVCIAAADEIERLRAALESILVSVRISSLRSGALDSIAAKANAALHNEQ